MFRGGDGGGCEEGGGEGWGRQQVVLTPEDWKWTQNTDGDSFLRNGDVVYVQD